MRELWQFLSEAVYEHRYTVVLFGYYFTGINLIDKYAQNETLDEDDHHEYFLLSGISSLNEQIHRCFLVQNNDCTSSSTHIDRTHSQMLMSPEARTIGFLSLCPSIAHEPGHLNSERGAALENNDDLNTRSNTNYNNNNSDVNNNYNNDNEGGGDNRNQNNGRNINNNEGNSNNDNVANNERNEQDDGASVNNNSNNNEGNNNNDNNRNRKNYNSAKVEEEEVDEEEDENSEDDDIINGNTGAIINEDETIKSYLLSKLSFESVEKSNTKLLVNNLSIITNTPYDSIEAQTKHIINENTNRKQKEEFIDLINMKSSSLSDEFSGTESMEYIHHNENENSFKEENWYASLVTVTQDISNDMSISPNVVNVPVLEPGDSEVQVVTGSDTLSAVICLEEGLADDDSWVEELDHDDFPEESSDNEDISFLQSEEDRRYTLADMDLSLHTIYEESGEDSEPEPEFDEVNPTELEKYFVFNICGTDSNTQNVNKDSDSFSESSSTPSENLDSVKQETTKPQDNSNDLIPSRLEKYFLSGFMGFSKRDSDSSVGSDSEGKHSPEQRRKKLVRARGTNRHSSLDNLSEEQQFGSESQSENSSSDAECNEENNSLDKNDGQFDTLRRTKKKKRSLVTSSIEQLENFENFEKSEQHIVTENRLLDNADAIDLSLAEEKVEEDVISSQNELIKNLLTSTPKGLTRKDSFNNWSSDEETNLMMSKMRTFFKNMIAQHKNASPIAKNRNKPPQLVYFESELTRLMKTVPGLRDEQVREIVEYLSSEDTWSDSYDSSDYTSSDLDIGTKKSPFQPNISVDYCKVPDIDVNGKKDTDLVYQCLMSFQRIEPGSDSPVSHNSPPLMNKVIQHIGTRLVALMHEVSEGTAASTLKTGRYQRRLQTKLPTICTTTEEEDDSIEERSPLPRSKSYDPLLEESRQETSDNERFSWRGSFESALMTGSDSRTRLPSTGENSASALALAAAKRRSASDLLFKSGNNSRENLDRVRSCGSIGGSAEEKIWSIRHARKRRGSVPDGGSNSGESADGENDSEDDDHISTEKPLTESLGRSTTLPRTLQTLNPSNTNSLPRLSSMTPSSTIYKANNTHQFGVKSARYRPPGYNNRNGAGSFATLCAPPRRDYTRRRPVHQPISSLSLLPSNVGTSDNCSVSSDISERTGILDNESEKSYTRISSVSVTRSDSMASVYSGAGEGRYGVVPIRGEVEFGLQYNYKAGDVEIHIKRCSDLAPVDVKRNRSDPYVKVYLLPDKSKSGKRKTRVKKHTLNPVFDEVLKYHVSLEELESRTLWLSVWHSDIFGRNDFLGEVVVPLVNKVFDDPLPKVYMLRERSELLDNVPTLKGEIIVALKFILSIDNKMKKHGKETGSLHVMVKEAKNLTAVKSNGTSDPFCKSYLLPNKGRSCKQKTPVLKRTCHPIWNHTFVYNNVTLEDLSQRCLELTIWDHDRLASNEFLGGVRLSLGTGLYNDKSVDWMDSNNREVALWQRMMDHPNFWVESSLMLRPSLDVRNKN